MYEMVDSEYSTNICKSLNISIGTVLGNTELMIFVSDHLKAKKICKRAVKMLPFEIRCVSDQYKT